MEHTILKKKSLFGLVRQVADETKAFIRQEAELAKTEISEKLTRLGKNAATLAAGGVVALVGLIAFIMGLGWLLAWAFQQAGLAPFFAGFVGLAVIGLLVIVAGGVLLLTAIKTISSQSLAPQRTLRKLEELRGKEPTALTETKPPPEPKPSSAELQARVEATETRLSETLNELGQRVSPRHIKAKAVQGIKDRPYYSSLFAMVGGFLSAFLIKRRLQRA